MRKTLIFSCFTFMIASCGIFGKSKYGCPSNGKNIGAERLLGGEPKAIKEASKASEYKGG